MLDAAARPGKRRSPDEEIDLMVRCAELYYLQRMTQAEVGQALGLTRLRVNQLLQRARQEGIVRIEVTDPRRASTALSDRLIRRFRLQDAVVVPSRASDSAGVMLDLARAASDWLLDHLDQVTVLGVGWGHTVHRVVSHIHMLGAQEVQPVQVVPLLGALGDARPEFRSNDLAKTLAEGLKGSWQPLDLPFVVETAELRDSLLKEPAVQAAVGLWDALDLALVSIGYDLSRSPLVRTPYFGASELASAEGLRLVGDILSRFFDVEGVIQPLPVHRSIVGIEIERVRRARVLAVAGGMEKTASILAALRGRLVDVLIIDASTAAAVLDAGGASSPEGKA